MGKSKTVVTAISKISEKVVDLSAALVVIYGVDLGRKYDLSGTITVGRSSKADIQIDQDSISRSHAEFRAEDGHVFLRDLDSTNGTYVNDDLAQGDHPLRNGDLVKIGRTIFKFIAGGNIEAAYYEEIYRLTTIDGLTQIFNRRYFEETLEREISRCHRYGRKLALAIFDIDHFKQVNDTHGHLAGDHVLKVLASVIRPRVRREDVFARYGGEEFALLLPELDVSGAAATAEKLRKVIEKQQIEFDQQRILITVSVGVSGLDPKAQDELELVRDADAKLYLAKSAGRNRVCS
jgi:two-component system, cell cycle response regulator